MSEHNKIKGCCNQPTGLVDNNLALSQGPPMQNEFVVPDLPAFDDALRISKELNIPSKEITALFELIGKEKVAKGLCSEGSDRFREALTVFFSVGIDKCIKYITKISENKVIGQTHIIRDFERAPYSIARVIEFIDTKKIKIEDIHIIASRLKNAVGVKSFNKGFSGWSLYYFFVALKKINTTGIDESISIILMLKGIFGKGFIGEAYEHGYLWFIEAIEIFAKIGIDKTEILIGDFRSRCNKHYFNKAFAHNPRSFARYIKFKSDTPDNEISFIYAGKKVDSGKILGLLHNLLEEYFVENEYICLAPSELIAFVFDAATKYFEGKNLYDIAIFLRNKYLSCLSKRNVYSLLKSIGPEIEVQKDLETYDLETAHIVAFFFLVQTSGDGLIEFPLGPAHYHGSLSEIVSAMSKVSIGKEFLIPRGKVIPLDVSISVPPHLIFESEFRKKATILRVINDLLYTADVRLATAFRGRPQDQSGIRFRKGRVQDIGLKESALAENRSGNLITNCREDSVTSPLIAHEASFEFYQMMYTSLAASFIEESERNEFEKQLAGLYFHFEAQVLEILKEENFEYVTNITSNVNLSFLELSYVRKNNPNLNLRLDEVVKDHLNLIDKEVFKEAIRRRMEQLRDDQRDIEPEIKLEIKTQKDIDDKYGEALKSAFRELKVIFT